MIVADCIDEMESLQNITSAEFTTEMNTTDAVIPIHIHFYDWLLYIIGIIAMVSSAVFVTLKKYRRHMENPEMRAEMNLAISRSSNHEQ